MLIWLFIGIQLLCTVVYAGSIISVAFSIQILINHFEQNFTFCANQDVTPQIKMHFIFGAICEKQIVSFSYRQRKWIFNERISTDLIDVCIWLTYSEREKKKSRRFISESSVTFCFCHTWNTFRTMRKTRIDSIDLILYRFFSRTEFEISI